MRHKGFILAVMLTVVLGTASSLYASTLNVTSLATDLTGSPNEGENIQITFSATGQITPLYYQYWLASGYQTTDYGHWQMLQDWSTSNVLNWTPSTDDHYVTVAYVADQPSSTTYHQAGLSIETSGNSSTPVQILGFTTDMTYPQINGTSITLNTDAAGGNGPLQYKYWYQFQNGPWTPIRDWDIHSNATWTPTQAGVYTLVVWVSDDITETLPPLAGMTCLISFPFVMGTAIYEPSSSPLPAKGVSFEDPNFHTTITRITDKTTDGYPDPGIQNEYAKADPENSDGTYVILRGNYASWYLYDTATFQVAKNLSHTIMGDWEPEPRWDASNPKVFYYVYGTELRSYNIDSEVSTTIHDFKNEFPSAFVIRTSVEGDASLDRRYWCFMVVDSNWTTQAVITYDKTSDSIIGQKTPPYLDDINWVGMDMSGNHCILGYSELTYPQVFSKDFSTILTLPDGTNGHGDFALTADGRDVLVCQNVRTDYISMVDLNTGVETPLVAIPFNVNTDIGLHISGNNAQTPGWVLVSTYGAKNPPPGESHSWMDNQLFLVELKSNPRIWRIAHTHAYISLNPLDEKNYFAEASATINTKGTRIYFGSNWENYTLDYSETYLVTLPGSWLSYLP